MYWNWNRQFATTGKLSRSTKTISAPLSRENYTVFFLFIGNNVCSYILRVLPDRKSHNPWDSVRVYSNCNSLLLLGGRSIKSNTICQPISVFPSQVVPLRSELCTLAFFSRSYCWQGMGTQGSKHVLRSLLRYQCTNYVLTNKDNVVKMSEMTFAATSPCSAA